MSGTKQTLVIYAPDGTEVTEVTSGKWDTAGIIQRQDGSWSIAAHGCSVESVTARTRTVYGRGFYQAMYTGSLWEATAPSVRKYFGTHKVVISGYFTPGEGWTQGLRMKAGRARIRRLLDGGATAISFQPADGSRTADFQADELRASLRMKRGA